MLRIRRPLLYASFDQLNKIYASNGIEISPEYLQLKLLEFQLVVEYELQKQEEKELLREQREKEREDKNFKLRLKRNESNWKRIEITLKIWLPR